MNKHCLALSLLTFAVSAQATPVLNCNNGAMLVEKKAGTGANNPYVVTIYNPGVVQFFKNETLKNTQVYDSYNRLVTLVKSLPRVAKFIPLENGSTALQITEFQYYSDAHFSTSGPPGTTLTPYQNGYRLDIRSSLMTSSHSVAFYDVGNWYFENCVRQ